MAAPRRATTQNPFSAGALTAVAAAVLVVCTGVTISVITGCATSKLWEFPPQIPAQPLFPPNTFSSESIELLNKSPNIEMFCSDSAHGETAAAEICQITPQGLKLMVPPDVKGWQATQPDFVAVTLRNLGPAFRQAASRGGLDHTELIISFAPTPDGAPMLGTLGIRLMPRGLNFKDLSLEDRRGNLVTTKISGFPAGGSIVIPLPKFLENSTGPWEINGEEKIPNRVIFAFGPNLITVGRPEETNRYWRAKEILNMSGSSQEFMPSGENVPGAATMITRIQLVRVGQ